MTSDLKSATSRANGAKSHGPKTPEGKENSSRNSLDHGFTSKKTVVLQCENEDDFQTMLGYYADTYRPGSPVEEDLVAEMVASRWRMQRLRMIETALMDSEMDREPPQPESQETPTDPGYLMAFAFRRLVDESRAISLASRYESRLHRIHERSHRTLRELQETRKQPAAEPISPALSNPRCPRPPRRAPMKNRETNPRPPLPHPPQKIINLSRSKDIAASNRWNRGADGLAVCLVRSPPEAYDEETNRTFRTRPQAHPNPRAISSLAFYFPAVLVGQVSRPAHPALAGAFGRGCCSVGQPILAAAGFSAGSSCFIERMRQKDETNRSNRGNVEYTGW